MKKLFNKVLAGAISLALIATLALGVSFSGNAKADNNVSIGKWSFSQGGVYASAQETDWGNYAYIKNVTMNGTGESIDGWLEGEGSKSQTQTALQSANGFKVQIDHVGWDRNWDTEPWRINPWSIDANVKSNMNPDHRYKVTFKAKATEKKYAYVGFETEVGEYKGDPWDSLHGATLEEGSDKLTIAIGTQEKTYTYIFSNYVGGLELKTSILLGAFGAGGGDDKYPEYKGRYFDYAGNEILGVITSEEASNWAGTVTVSDFTIEDLDPEKPTVKPKPTEAPETEETEAPTVAPKPTQAPTVKPTPAKKTLGKVTKVKIKNPKKKTIKVSWKKVKNAKSYQVKVGKKTYPAKKTSRKIKNKKFKKGKTVKVKVRAIAKGYKAGPWSKTAKKKLKK